MKKHKRYRNQIKDDKRKEYDEMDTSHADMRHFRRPAYSVQHPDGYPDNEYSDTRKMSNMRSDADENNKGTAPELPK